MELSSIFLGRFSFSDLVEFSENLFIYCSRFMFTPFSSTGSVGNGDQIHFNSDGMASGRIADRNYKQRLFGLFLCYSFYFLQPSQYVVPISVTSSQLDDFYEFISSVLLPEENFEALYCFYRLLNANAFSIAPVLGNFNPLLQGTFHPTLLDKSSSESSGIELVQDFGLLFSLSNSEVLKQSESLHQRYFNMKTDCGLNLPNGTKMLSESPMDVMGRLLKESEEIYSRQCTLEEEGKGVIDRRNKIRQNAFSQSGKMRRDRRHRNARE
ncbi:hypothetical protein niasHS_002571 [Heterodera schachtii]|uniref:Uncharacterized protein n=1 Tax=Heterodera schachtii TaxID=97005 RepID=A0ABD2KKB8_HETSC